MVTSLEGNQINPVEENPTELDLDPTPSNDQLSALEQKRLTELLIKRAQSRRDFLKAMLGGVLSLAGAATVDKVRQVIDKHPELLEKTYRSVTTGKIWEDIDEVIESRLRLNNAEASITSFEASEKYPVEEWMLRVAEAVQVLELQKAKQHFPMLLFEITNSVSALPVQKKEGVPSSGGFPRVFHDLGATVDSLKVMTLPAPQYQMQPQTEQKVPEFIQYLMYAWAPDQPTAATECTGKRGGLVLTSDGQAVIASPETFYEYYQQVGQTTGPRALMEYAFILDSGDMSGSFTALEEASQSVLKDMSYTSEFTNAILTVYKADASFQTFLLASYEPNLKNSFSDSSAVSSVCTLSPVQLSAVAQQVTENLEGVRFTLALTDPSPEAANCYGPWSLSEEELQQAGFAFEPSQYPDWMADLGVKKEYHRSVGSVATFTFPRWSFPWILATGR